MEHEDEAGLPQFHRPTHAPPLLNRLLLTFSRILRPKPKEAQSDSDETSEPYGDASSEEACAKIWSIYVSEAERYDSALVESWKADMEGMLIFSGLFSAILTAFLIESYKTLQPNSGDLTVAAILQVSRQLAALADGSTFSMQTLPVFQSTSGSLVCNTLWFLSLSLSLTCALLATLVEQWSREFLHRTQILSSPGRRARVFSFLYFGLKDFRMHTIVDVIPFLLHASLVLFLVGLAVFLLPVNRVMMYLMCAVLAVFICLYAVLTILPIIHLDCPYRTPLSASLWWFIRKIKSYSSHKDTNPADQTVTEAVVDGALWNTADRDQRALEWTLESLTDDHKFLPFVEAIPDVIYGPDGFREVNDHLFGQIMGCRNGSSPLVSRILNLLDTTWNMGEADPLCIRRRSACWKSLWALCMMPNSPHDFDPPDGEARFSHWDIKSTSRPFGLLGFRYHRHMWLRQLHSTLRDLLYQYYPGVEEAGGEIISQMQEILRLIAATRLESYLGLIGDITKERIYPDIADYTLISASQLEKARKGIDDVLDLPHWSADKADMVAHFISRCLERLAEDPSALPYSVLLVCTQVLSHFKALPKDDQRTLPGLPLAMNLETLSLVSLDEEHMLCLDEFAQILLRLLPYMRTRDQTSLFSYLVRRYNFGRNYSALKVYSDLDDPPPGYIQDLAHVLGNHLRCANNTALNGDHYSTVVHTAVILVQCIDSTVIGHLASEIGRQLIFPVPLEIDAAGSICTLLKLARALDWARLCPPSLSMPYLEAICQHELLRPRCPLFLPKNIDISIVCHSLSCEITHVYLHCMAVFFVNCSSPVWASMRAFDFVLPLRHWSHVDNETQTPFFHAILEFERKLETLDADFTSVVNNRLWSWSGFWVWDEEEGTRIASVGGIHPPCLLMLREALEIHHKAAGRPHSTLDTQWSQRLAQAITAALQGLAGAEVVVSSSREP